jgi:hypothetical protein
MLDVDDFEGLDDGLKMKGSADGNAFVFEAPEMTGEQLRASVESLSDRRTKTGKVYGVKDNKKGRLTAKQRLFVNLIVTQGISATEAYRKAYNVTTDRMGTSAVDANRLMRNPKVQSLLDVSLSRTEESIVNDSIATRRHIMTELLAHSREMKSESSKLKALELMGKAVGMFVDKVESKVEEVSADQLKRELETHLALLDGATKH